MLSTKETCQSFKKTFNSNVIDQADILTQAIFYKTANEYTAKKKDVLLSLLQNHYTNKKPIIDYISGPSTLTLYTNPNSEKIFYIFGEYHGVETCSFWKSWIQRKATNIQTYLWKLFTTTDVFIDLFVEIPTFIGTGYTNFLIQKQVPSYLGKIRQRFETCIQTATRAVEKCKLGRVHYIDIRMIDDKYLHSKIMDNDDFIYLYYTFRFFIGQKLKDFISTDNRIRTILSKFHSFSQKQLLSFIWNSYKKDTLLQKEISRSYMGNKIKKFIYNNRLKILVQAIFPIIKAISKDLLDYPYKTDKKLYQEFAIALIKLNSPRIDIYALCRIFKKFNIADPSTQPEEPTNVIIYAGDYHSNIYRQFLEKNGWSLSSLARSKEDDPLGCLSMKGINQPLFQRL